MSSHDHGQSMVISDAAMTAAAAFRARGWTWTVHEGESVDPFVPDAPQVERMLLHLLENARQMETGWHTRCGRLAVQKDQDGNLHLSLDLGVIWKDGSAHV